MRHKGRAPAWVWIAGAACVLAIAVLLAPRSQSSAARPVDFAQVKAVIDQRCAACHAQKPSFPGIAEAPKGVLLDTTEQIRARAAQIQQQAVLTRAMPPGNLTQMTEEERELLRRALAQ
jgi:uncharacterized membrane protein